MAQPTTSRRASVGKTRTPEAKQQSTRDCIGWLQLSKNGKRSRFYGKPSQIILDRLVALPRNEQWKYFLEGEWLVLVNTHEDQGARVAHGYKDYMAKIQVTEDDRLEGELVEGLGEPGDVLHSWWYTNEKDGDTWESLALYIQPADWEAPETREVMSFV